MSALCSGITRSLKGLGLAGAALAGALLPLGAAAYPTLPPFGSTFDGVPISQQFDDFYGYCACIMDQLQDEGYLPSSYGAFDFATGSGGLDVLLYTGAGGQDNQDVGTGGGFDFEDPVYDTGGATTDFEGWWGQNDHDNDPVTDPGGHSGPVTVGNVLAYLQSFDPSNTTPVFYADLNQAGGAKMDVAIHAYIWDPVNSLVVDSWSMDAVNNGVYDENSPATVPQANSVVGTSGTTYTVNLTGSGKTDFIFYAPGMDLTLFDTSYWLVLNGHIGDWTASGNELDDGFEEFFLTGGIGVASSVPLPGTLWLCLAGLCGLMVARRRVG